MAKKDFQYGGWNSYTLQCGRIMTLISPGGMWLWNRDREFTKWQHPAIWLRDSGMTRHLIRLVAAPCNVTRSSGIMTLNFPACSTLQCGRRRWDDMPLNLPKRPPYWNSTSGFDFDHITAVDIILH